MMVQSSWRFGSAALRTVLATLVAGGLVMAAAQQTPATPAGQPGMQQQATLPPGVDPEQPVAQIGPDEPLTQQQFADEFDRGMRGLAMQHGWHYTDDLRAEFDRFRGQFLEQWATQQALVREAEERGLEVTDAELDQRIEQARVQWGEDFDRTLADLGFADEAAYRDAVHEGMLAQRVIDDLRAGVQPADEELREFHEQHRARYFQDRPFDEVRTDVEQRFVSEQLRGEFRDLRAQHGIEVFPDRLRVDQPVGLGVGQQPTGQQPVTPGMPRQASLPPGVDPDQPVAQIGPDEPLTQQQFADEFDRAMRGLAMQHGFEYTDELRTEFDRFRGDFLEQWATQQALVREAEERGIEITDAEVDRQLEQARAQWGEGFDQAITDLGFEDEASYRDAVREALLAERVAFELRASVEFTDEELREFHEQHRARYFQDREFDEVRADVEQRFVGEQLQDEFAGLRAQHGIEVFPDRLAQRQQPIGTN